MTRPEDVPDPAARPTTARHSRRITHRDVAQRAGVSPAVVSYVVNGGPRTTSPDTRARVLRAIKDLGYHPNAAARGLRMQRTQTVGFIDNDYSPLDVYLSPYSAGILTGLTAELGLCEYHLLISPHQVGQDHGPLERMLRSGRLDGVIVRLVEESATAGGLLELIAGTGVPCVCIERPADPALGFRSVLVDDGTGAFEATCYLADLGHRRIAHLAGDRRYASALSRRAGYERALVSRGLPLDAALIEGHSWTPLDVDAALARLMALAEPPTAIFAASDSLAFRAIEVTRADGQRVPEDLAVVGFDDIPLAQEMVPPLTTVQIPLAVVGRLAARHLLDLIDRADSPASTEVLPVRLIRRGTA